MNGLTLTLPKLNSGPFTFGTRTNKDRDVRAFDKWLHQVTPTYSWEWPHLRYIRTALDQVTTGAINRLMIFVPPQHGKSQMTTIRYPVWRLEHNPALRVIVGCYNQTLANRFSRQARKIAEGRIALDRERRAVEEWQTAAGGIFRAVGVGAGITGQGGDLILIDDPVKSREEAESQTYRDRCYDWYSQDLFTRQGPQAAIILIMTRWHEADLAGRILASEEGPRWTVVNLPAIAEAGDPLGRGLGEALCPARYDEAALAERRMVLGSYAFNALYQGHPTPPGGGMFQRDWFDIVNVAPAQAQRVRAWDRAATEKDGDYTVGLLMAKDNDNVFYVEDVVRGQYSDLAAEKIIAQTAATDAERFRNVTTWLEQEPGSSGKAVVQITIRALAGYNVKAERSTGDKATRAQPFAAQCEARNIKLVRGAWNGAYLDELCSFPYGAHDDQVDGSSLGFNKLALPGPKAGTW